MFIAFGYLLFLYTDCLFPVKADPSQKTSEELDAAGGLGPDLTASVETTYSEQSSSSAGSSSSSDQPIYFRWVDGLHVYMKRVCISWDKNQTFKTCESRLSSGRRVVIEAHHEA